MIANLKNSLSTLLKLNFLLLDLKQQLSKTHNSFLNTTHAARNVDFIDEHTTPFSTQPTPLATLTSLMNTLPSRIKSLYSTLSKSCYYHIRELRCIRPYLDFKNIQHHCHFHCPNLTTVIISSTTFQTINLNGSNKFKILLIALLLRLLNSLIITPIRKSLHKRKVNEHITISFFLLPTNFLLC